jgi:hypothetical protein
MIKWSFVSYHLYNCTYSFQPSTYSLFHPVYVMTTFSLLCQGLHLVIRSTIPWWGFKPPWVTDTKDLNCTNVVCLSKLMTNWIAFVHLYSGHQAILFPLSVRMGILNILCTICIRRCDIKLVEFGKKLRNPIFIDFGSSSHTCCAHMAQTYTGFAFIYSSKIVLEIFSLHTTLASNYVCT